MENHRADDIYLKSIGSSKHLEQLKCPIKKINLYKIFLTSKSPHDHGKQCCILVEVYRHFCCGSWHFIEDKSSTSSYLIS